MSYDFSKILDLSKLGELQTIRQDTSNQLAIFDMAIANIISKTQGINYKEKAKKVAEVMFPMGQDINESELLNNLAIASDKVILEKFDNLYATAERERPSRFTKNNNLQEVEQRINKLQHWLIILQSQRVISESKIQQFNQEYQNLKVMLNNASKGIKNKNKIIISIKDPLIQTYNKLNEMFMVSNLTERVAFLAEKGVAQLLNTDEMAIQAMDNIIAQYHLGDQGSKTIISTQGMTQQMTQQLGELGYEEGVVKGTLEYKNPTYDKADLKFDFILNNIKEQFGVSLKTGDKSFGLQRGSRLAAYLSQNLFLETYTNNLLRLMWGKGDPNDIQEEFNLAQNMVVFTALTGYESQGAHQAELMMHIDTKLKSVSFYPVSEAINNLIKNNLKGVKITSNVPNLFSFGSLPNLENNFISTKVDIEATNINKMLKNNKYTYMV